MSEGTIMILASVGVMVAVTCGAVIVFYMIHAVVTFFDMAAAVKLIARDVAAMKQALPQQGRQKP